MLIVGKENLKDQILKDLKKTGFITELMVAQKFSEKAWKSKLNESYYDKDLEISREIDLIAIKKAKGLKNNIGLWLKLIIEVKKTTNPWIIFTNDLMREQKHFNELPGWTLIHGGENYISEDSGGVFTPNDIHEQIMRVEKQRIGTAFHEAFKPPNEKSKIFQSIMSVCKAAVDKASSLPEIYRNRKHFKASDEIYLEFFHPIVVVDGPLFEVYIDGDNNIQLEEQKWIPVKYEYSSNKYSKGDGNSKTFYPDIVTYKALDEYVSLVDRWLNSMGVNFDSRIDTLKHKGK